MNAFIVYVALPALFFNLVSRTPFAELANGGFVALTMARTACAFALSFVMGLAITRGDDFALLRLFLRAVRDNDSADFLFVLRRCAEQ